MALLQRATEAQGGVYVVDGVALPRVTSILNVIASPGLDRWRRQIGFAEADRVSKEAAEFGTRLHKAIEHYLKETAAWPYVEDLVTAMLAFGKWHADNVAEVLSTEQLVVHKGLQYAGTCDALLRLKDGRVVVADWKSSNRKGEAWALQLVAYQAALMHSGEHVDGRIVVQMPSRQPGKLLVHEYDDVATDWAVFRAALRIYQWQQHR